MRKTLIIALREYKAAVRTKSFIIGLIIAPVLMGGSLAVFMILRDRIDTTDKKIAVIDHSGLVEKPLQQSAEQHNENEVYDNETGEKVRPAYILEFIEADTTNPFEQRLELSNRVRSGELHAFVEVGPAVIYPYENQELAYIRYYSEHAFMDDVRYWFSDPINIYLRQLRLNEMNLPPDQVQNLFYWINIDGMGLVEVDRRTGDVKDAERTNELQSFLVPYFMVLLMFMMVMMGTGALISAVMEEKMERIAEVLLASVTPFQFMAGKILGSVSVSLTTASIYVIAAVITTQQVGAGDMIPYHIIPWFFIYLVLFVIMTGAVMTALGASCNDNKDAQSLQFPAMLPLILPLFLLIPVMQNPLSNFSFWLSLFPPFTPTLMLIRLASPVTIPLWQPYVGLIGVVLFTALSVWIGGRIFRTSILLQGQKPTLANLVKYAIR